MDVYGDYYDEQNESKVGDRYRIVSWLCGI